MKILIPTALSLFIFTGSYAQSTDTTKTSPNPNARRNGYETYQSTSQIIGAGAYTIVNMMDHRYEGLRGTPYFLNEWNKGLIEMAAGQHYKDVLIKFDAYRQHLLLKRTWVGGDSIIVNANQVKSFQLSDNGQLYLFRRYPTAKTSDEVLREGYFMVLYQGKSSLLKRIVKSFRQADYKNPYSNDTRYDEFRNVTSYYLLKPDQTLEKVKLSDKSLIDALGDRKDELKAFVKQENLNFKSENDAIKLVQKYDSL